jgi:hypothetical protein
MINLLIVGAATRGPCFLQGAPRSNKLVQRPPVRRFGAKLDKKIVDRQAARPSSWKTPFIATSIAW